MSSTFSYIDDIDNETTTDKTFELAQRIWDNDITVYEDLKNVVEWIGDGTQESSIILKKYMAHFDFHGLKLEQAFRSLCGKLPLRGETQQIDRVLTEFSIRYFECNPKNIFGTIDVIHAIIYSLLLLNTDLHVAQGEHRKMRRDDFIKNTMSAVLAQVDGDTATPASTFKYDNNNILTDGHRIDSISLQSVDWAALQRTSSIQSITSTKSSGYTQSLDSFHNVDLYLHGSQSWQEEVKIILKQMYANVRQTQIAKPITVSTSSTLNNSGVIRKGSSIRRGMGTIMWRGTRDPTFSNSPITDDSVIYPTSPTISSGRRSSFSSSVSSRLQNPNIPTFYTSNAPYYKEGMVVRKHLLEKVNQKAKHRDWRDCFMVIDRSQLRMYKLDHLCATKRTLRNTLLSNRNNSPFSDTASQMSSSSEKSHTVGGGDWMSSAQLIGTIDLKHTLSNTLPSGYSRQRQYAFALQQSNGAVYLFQVGSVDQVHEWVSTCNYWAARESKEPLAGGVGSMEYGWGDCLNREGQSIHIDEWDPPEAADVSSMLDEQGQFEALSKHVQELSIELDEHRDIKQKMELRFRSLKHATMVKAMCNWENKSHYLLHEIIKFQNYCDSIERSLALQAEIMAASPF